jgi:hypothetical protein
MKRTIPAAWSKALWVDLRPESELLVSPDHIPPGPYAGQIYEALQLGISAVLCSQSNPIAAFFVLDENAPISSIDSIHHALWNQGVIDILLVIHGDYLKIFSLWKRPVDGSVESRDDRLVEALHLLNDAEAICGLIPGIESGRLRQEDRYRSAFDVSTRVDATLLGDLEGVCSCLSELRVPTKTAHELLLQSMFMLYLWDRGIIDLDYLSSCDSTARYADLHTVLRESPQRAWKSLLKRLSTDLNGNMVNYGNFDTWELAAGPLSDFLEGTLNFKTGQRRFFRLYQFNHIPVELLSEVYDRFLEEGGTKKETGAYYTPRRLALLVADQAWETLTFEERISNPKILDPACGSGIFLVALFHRMVGNWRANHQKRPSWGVLVEILKCLHGTDINQTAIQIATFSLCLAVLNERNPRQIKYLMDSEEVLPKLQGNNLFTRDFFDHSTSNKYDLVIGNPPWGEAGEDITSGEAWCDDDARKLPVPNREVAWPFIWKAGEHVKRGKQLTLLLPVMSIFYNNASRKTVSKWIKEGCLNKVTDLSDLRALLFPKAKVPAAILSYSPKQSEHAYTIEHLSPKADLNFLHSEIITLAPSDRKLIPSEELAANPSYVSKQAMWATNLEKRILHYILGFPKLGEFVFPCKKARKMSSGDRPDWGMGEGFRELSKRMKGKGDYVSLPIIQELPLFSASLSENWVLTRIETDAHDTDLVHREKFYEAFGGPHIVFPNGLRKDQNYKHRLRATYSEENFCFKSTITGITIPNTKAGRNQGKVITAILNSKLIAWYLFQATKAGIDRDRVVHEDIYGIPFALPEQMSHPSNAKKAYIKIVQMMNLVIAHSKRLDSNRESLNNPDFVFPSIKTISVLDDLVFDYYGIKEEERQIIDESLGVIRPAMHPGTNSYPVLWHPSTPDNWKSYCSALERGMQLWMAPNVAVSAEAITASKDFVIIKASLSGKDQSNVIFLDDYQSLLSKLPKTLRDLLAKRVSRNVYLIRLLYAFFDDDLYLVKPRERRFWLTSSAYDDSERLVSDLIATQGRTEGVM